MFKKKYKVKGVDVNDYMVMQEFAYHLYTVSHITSYLRKSGYPKRLLESLKLKIENSNKQLDCIKNLMFTQDFSMYLDSFNILEINNDVEVKTRFFNANNELCAILVLKS